MKRFSTLAVAVAIAPLAFAQENSIEEIVITSSLVHASSTATAFTVSGEELVQAGSQSLGEHLSDLPGVSSNNFGPAVGQPVIRGMSGNRVKLLQNGLVIRDVSSIGPDHANDLDLNNVQQIEVVRGASALLYSNGASGGIINVVDNTIARSDVEEPTAYISGESQSVNNGQGFSAGARGNVAGFNLSYDYSEFDADSYDIPRGAILHDEEHEGEHEDHDEDMTTLANSDYETESQRIGISKTGDWGYVGASYQELSSSYGIPFHGEHAEHEGEDHDDDHEGEDHDEEGHGDEHEEHGEERIVSSTDSEILSLEGRLNINGDLLNGVRFSVRDTDYLLAEAHAEEEHEGEEHEGEEHDDHGHSEEPTFFSNESTEIQLIFELGTEDAPRRVVVNRVSEELSVKGEEAFMEPVKSTETTIGFFAGLESGGFDIDMGVRWDDIERQGKIREMHHEEDHEEDHDEDHDDDSDHDGHGEEGFELEPFTYRDSSFSGALSLSRPITDSLELSFNLGLVNRTPSAMELFMNGEHLAVARYEVGDANLDRERANNIDIGLVYSSDEWFANVSLYRNRVDNYVYLRDEMEDDHEEEHGEEHDEDHDSDHDEHDHEGLLMSSYTQQDATFSGYEIELGRRFTLAGGDLEIRLQRDAINAEFARGGDVPRITPARNVLAFDYTRGMTAALLEIQDVDRQTAISDFETPTNGFTLVNARLSHSVELGDRAVLTIGAYGRNLTDEVARNHTSFVKNEVPLAGRNIGIRASLSF